TVDDPLDPGAGARPGVAHPHQAAGALAQALGERRRVPGRDRGAVRRPDAHPDDPPDHHAGDGGPDEGQPGVALEVRSPVHALAHSTPELVDRVAQRGARRRHGGPELGRVYSSFLIHATSLRSSVTVWAGSTRPLRSPRIPIATAIPPARATTPPRIANPPGRDPTASPIHSARAITRWRTPTSASTAPAEISTASRSTSRRALRSSVRASSSFCSSRCWTCRRSRATSSPNVGPCGGAYTGSSALRISDLSAAPLR